MKILVIGGRGQMGRSLSAAALPPGIKLSSVSRPQVDIEKACSVTRTLDAAAPDLVINVAAYTAVDRAEVEVDRAFAANSRGPATIAAACGDRGVPLVHISTDYVFDGSKASPYSEADPVAPLSVYGRSKLEGEQSVALGCPQHIILRTAWLHSPYGHNFVKTMLRLATSQRELSVVGDQVGCPTYAPHLASVILSLTERFRMTGSLRWGIYHAAGAGAATWCEFAREVFRQSALLNGPHASVNAISTAEYATPVRRPANSRLDCTALERHFGLRLPSWQQGVAECIASIAQEDQATSWLSEEQ